MTTVAANLECMAADHRVTEDGTPLCHISKLKRINGRVYGACGDTFAALAFLKWLEETPADYAMLYDSMFPDDEVRASFTVLELSEAGLALWNGWGVRMPLLDAAYAIGTGADIALNAMAGRAKLSPSEAVKEAPVSDSNTGVKADREPEEMWLYPKELELPPKKRLTRKPIIR